jgi:hypothetical protein
MLLHWKQVLCGAAFLGIAAQSPLVGQVAPPSKPPLQIYFTAAGKHDSSATPLQSEMDVSIDGLPAQIASLHPADHDKLLFALLVDISGSEAATVTEIKAAAIKLFQGLLAEGDEGHLVVFNTQVAMSRKPVQLSEVQRKLDSVQFLGRSALFDAIGDTCTEILSKSENPEYPRRVILLITDGMENTSRIDSSKAEEIAEREGVPLFALSTEVSLFNNSEFGPRVTQSGQFHHLIEATGGLEVSGTTLEKGVAPLINAVHRQWALELVPRQNCSQRLCSLKVKTSQKDLRICVPANILLP